MVGGEVAAAVNLFLEMGVNAPPAPAVAT